MLKYLNKILHNNGIVSIIIPTSNTIKINVGISSFSISRELLVDSTTSLSMKFAEKIQFAGRGNSNYAIAIGYNPSLASLSGIDHTNELIANYLYNQSYDGYYLLNIYPDVQSTKISKSSSAYPNYMSINGMALNSYKMDSFIFWGSSVYINLSTATMLNALSQNLYSIGFHNGKKSILHKHPGRGVTSQTISSFLRAKPITFSFGQRGYLR